MCGAWGLELLLIVEWKWKKGERVKGRLSTTDAGPSNAFHRQLGSLVQVGFSNKPRLFAALVSTIKEKQRFGVKTFSKFRTNFFLFFSVSF